MGDDRKLSLPGLPPLPKSLSAAVCPLPASSTTHSTTASPLNHAQINSNDLFLGASTSAAARNHHSQRHGSLSSTQESLSDRESLHSRASSHSSHHTPTNADINLDVVNSGTNSTLDTQLAILRREMYDLRQLDLSLLSQLWALNESIQGFRTFLQEQDALSPPSPSPTPSGSNSLSSEPEDDSYPVQPRMPPPLPPLLPGGSTTSHASTSSASGTSGSSSAASSMSKRGLTAPPPPPHRAPPQLPRSLQPRMRRTPPPPPPSRPKPTAKAPDPQRPV